MPSWCASLWRDGQPFDFRVPFIGEDVFPFLMAFLPEAEDVDVHIDIPSFPDWERDLPFQVLPA